MTDLTTAHIDAHLRAFVAESNLIEGIERDPSGEELRATRAFIVLPQVSIAALVALVAVYAPHAVLRDRSNLNVCVGRYVAPGGGMSLMGRLGSLLSVCNHLEANRNAITPWHAHVEYEKLHPFTDGNGRSGRTLWAWCMLKRSEDPFALSFLHRFYYQTLEHPR